MRESVGKLYVYNAFIIADVPMVVVISVLDPTFKLTSSDTLGLED